MQSDYPTPEVPDVEGIADLEGVEAHHIANAGEDDQPQASAGNHAEEAYAVQSIPATVDDDQAEPAEPAENPTDVEGAAFYAGPAEEAF